MRDETHTLCLLFNAATDACEFILPPEHAYRVCIDSARAPPDDAPDADRAEIIREKIVAVAGNSVQVLQSL